MAEKLAASKPYNYFLTCITSSPQTHSEPLSVTFQEILDPSLGELESSVQINFIVNADWLFAQYYFSGNFMKPLLILYGRSSQLESVSQTPAFSHITAHEIKMPQDMGLHHSKMMLLAYKDGSMRVVVSTANLYAHDWDDVTQGLWISDKLPKLLDGADRFAGESPTRFRDELLRYLCSYNLPHLETWMARIRKTDFTSVNVFLVTSVPGTYNESWRDGYPHGHGRVLHLLSKNLPPINEDSTIFAQSSSLGGFGPHPNAWLMSEWLNSFRQDTQPISSRRAPNLQIIYPTMKSVAKSYIGFEGAPSCLGYEAERHAKQPWLSRILNEWKADCRYRSKAMPHIKTYCRWSEKKLFWYLLTSANLSKGAWGFYIKGRRMFIRSYEAGVLFLPQFVTGTDYFSMDDSDMVTPVFPSLYDIPLTKYTRKDLPYVVDISLTLLKNK